MRAKLQRCPNHNGCLIAYRGEDIEVLPTVTPVCPECGSVLEPRRKPRTSLVPTLVSTTLLALLLVAAWMLWPHVVRWWTYITTPPR